MSKAREFADGKKPGLYISWHDEACEMHEIGPFWSISPDGTGIVIGQKWVAYSVQQPSGGYRRISVPYIHSIFAR